MMFSLMLRLVSTSSTQTKERRPAPWLSVVADAVVADELFQHRVDLEGVQRMVLAIAILAILVSRISRCRSYRCTLSKVKKEKHISLFAFPSDAYKTVFSPIPCTSLCKTSRSSRRSPANGDLNPPVAVPQLYPLLIYGWMEFLAGGLGEWRRLFGVSFCWHVSCALPRPTPLACIPASTNSATNYPPGSAPSRWPPRHFRRGVEGVVRVGGRVGGAVRRVVKGPTRHWRECALTFVCLTGAPGMCPRRC